MSVKLEMKDWQIAFDALDDRKNFFEEFEGLEDQASHVKTLIVTIEDQLRKQGIIE